MLTPLIVPGLHGSSPEHWQSWMQSRLPGAVRVGQRDWSDPDLEAWSARVRREIMRSSNDVLIIAHSFGVLASIEAIKVPIKKVAGALLVAPASPSRFGSRNVAPITRTLDIPALIVASRNDPWMSLAEASAWAEVWGAELLDLGTAGHVNVASGFGPWPKGLELYERLAFRALRSRRGWEPDIFEQLGDIA